VKNTPANSLKRNFRLIYAINFLLKSEFTLPIFILFGKEHLGLSFFQAGSFFIVMYLTYTLTDFFGGTLADSYGRRRLFFWGVALHFLGFLPFVVTESYPLLLVASVVSGLGIAFSSSNFDALIYEQAQELGKQKEYQRGNANTQIFTFLGRIYASLLGGVAYVLLPTLPFLLTLAALVLAFFVGTKTKFSTSIEEEAAEHVETITKAAVRTYRKNYELIRFTVTFALTVLLADLLFSYYQPYYIKLNVSPTTLGLIYTGISALSAIGSFLMRKLPDRFSAHTINGFQILGVLLTSLVLYSLEVPLVYFAPLILGVVSGFGMPNLRLFVNKHTANRVRVSVLSIATTVMNVGIVTGMLLAYGLADNNSARAILGIVVAGSLVLLFVNSLLSSNLKSKISPSSPAG